MRVKRVTVNLPDSLLREAQKVSKKGITETLVEGLEAVVRKGALERARGLRGKIHLGEDSGRRTNSIRD